MYPTSEDLRVKEKGFTLRDEEEKGEIEDKTYKISFRANFNEVNFSNFNEL